MKKYIAALSFMLLVACSSFKPVEDPAQVPSNIGVYTVESNVCGVPFVGTGGCLIGPNDDLSKKMVHIKVPATNDQKKTATLQILSPACSVDIAEEVQAGEDVTYSVKDLVQQSHMSKDCDLSIVLIPAWEDQDTFQIRVYPLLGRIFLKMANHTPTQLVTIPVTAIMYTQGFIKISQRSGSNTSAKGNASDTFTTSFQINTQGSKAGRIVLVGCNMELLSADYTQANPTISVPSQTVSCKFLGSVLRLDAPGDLSFMGAIDVFPSNYSLLARPSISMNSNGTGTMSFDPLVSAFDVDGKFYPGHVLKAKKEEIVGSHLVREITTNGRQATMLVKNGVIKWILQ
jgi:hypothetical protein